MKRPTFINGVVLAAILAFFASAVVAVFIPFVGVSTVARIVIPALAFTYLLYLFNRNSERTGRVITLAAWGAMTLITWWFAPALPFYLLIHVGAIWLVRSLYFYSGVLPALIDFGLSGLSVIVSIWAISRTGSVFLATWCFFLVEALFVLIPTMVHGDREPQSRERSRTPTDHENFARAKRQADQALSQLFTQ
jgi:hypothetical protein